MAGTSKRRNPCRECTMSFPLLFSVSSLIVSLPSHVYIRADLILPDSCSLRYLAACGPQTCGADTTPSSIPRVPPHKPRVVRSTTPEGTRLLACYREDCENKPIKHGSDVGIYTGAAPQCLIPFNRGRKEVM